MTKDSRWPTIKAKTTNLWLNIKGKTTNCSFNTSNFHQDDVCGGGRTIQVQTNPFLTFPKVLILPYLITPPQKSVPEGRRPSRATALRSNASPLGRSPSGTDFWGGVWKEMTKKSTHWKWKQWKPEKVTDWCKNGAKSATIWDQNLIVCNSG